MRGAVWLACLAALAAAPARAAPQYDTQVVALLVTRQRFDEYRPWAKQDPDSGGGSAVVVEGSLLLTEAHIIRDATLIQVRKHASARRVPARVVHVDYDIDLALLAVDAPGFFDDLEPVRIADSVPTEGLVQSLRWKDRQLEISNSRVARISSRRSPFGSIRHAFLMLTTDLSAGGWSEPVFFDGSFVGLTVAQDGQHASVIPAEIIAAYLRLTRSADYRGFASIEAEWQANPDPSLAAFLGLEGEPRGAVLLEIPWGSTGCDVLQPRDLLLSLDGHPIDSLGNYRHPRYGQLQFHHIVVEGHAPGDVVPAGVLRASRRLDLELELRRHPTSHWLVPPARDDSPPPYLVAGGLVIRELDGGYLRAWGSDWRSSAPSNLVYRYHLEMGAQTPERRRILVLSHVLPDAYNIGYHDLANISLLEINGRPVDSIAAADEAFRHPRDGLHRLVFHRDDLRSPVVLDAADFEEATRRILAAYDVPARMRTRGPDAALAAVECAPRH